MSAPPFSALHYRSRIWLQSKGAEYFLFFAPCGFHTDACLRKVDKLFEKQEDDHMNCLRRLEA